ncbi:hypothetical protein GQX73_g6022 [Xylaria multiplex]|uniref:Amino acid permease/ SLC12A domain-containing protein n=1 Tax=Xylaria multiplex TaxID=323545 RepID=A0A7C8N653_9PEZI|nr:hypothetical protein GQX73_g6022 [Xylaria multiplex]
MRHDSADAAQLTALGYATSLPRRFTPLSLFGLAFNILNTWAVLSASLPLSLPSGGPSAAVWGLFLAGTGNLCLAISLAEFLSAYPTAGGQYHWLATISPRQYAPFLSWLSGWITVFGWIAVTASGSLLASQLIVGLIMPPEGHQPTNMHQFMAYIFITLIALVVNMWMSHYLPLLNKFTLFWSLTGLVVVPLTVLAFNRTHWAEPSFVFGGVINESGWPDGIAWLLGSLQAGLALNGFDAVSHIIEEIPNAQAIGPRIMIGSVALGIFTGFCFIVAILTSSGGADEIAGIIQSPLGPLMHILYTSIGDRRVATGLLLIVFLFGTIAIMTTSSRMVFAFARDGGLPASHIFQHVNKRHGIPASSLCLSAIITSLFGCIFLISATAFNAISSASVASLGLSYTLPIIVHCIQGRDKLPPRVFTLSPILGWAVNLVGVVYGLSSSMLFLLPSKLPITRYTMNYGQVALAAVLILCVQTWVSHGRYHYCGPATTQYVRILNNVDDTDDIDDTDDTESASNAQAT